MDYQFFIKEGLIVGSILLAALLVGQFGIPLLFRFFEKIAKRTPTEIDNRIINLAKRPTKLLVFLIAIYFISARLPLPARARLIADGIVFVFAVFVFVKFIGQAWVLVLEWWGRHLGKEDVEERFEKEFLPLIKMLSWSLLYVIGMIMVLKHFNFDVLSLVTALGVSSLAFGLAAKDTLANVISGFVILIDRPFRPGDRIQLENGTIGDVTNIGVRSTKIRTPENNLLIIPNQNIMNSSIINYAFPNSNVRVSIEVGVGYDSNVEVVKNILLDIAKMDQAVLKNPLPSAQFVTFGDSALKIHLDVFVNTYSDSGLVRDRLNSAILREFSKRGISIPFPTQNLNISKEKIGTIK